MKKILLYLLLAFVSTTTAAQVTRQQRVLAKLNNRLKLIDSTNYNSVVGVDSVVKVVCISNNYCVGTQYMYLFSRVYDSLYGSSVRYIPIISCPINELDEVQTVAESFGYHDTVYVVNHAVHPNSIRDDRTAGFKLRNAVCTPCAADIVGTPYFIYYGFSNEIIARGYRRFNDFDSTLSNYLKKKQSVGQE